MFYKDFFLPPTPLFHISFPCVEAFWLLARHMHVSAWIERGDRDGCLQKKQKKKKNERGRMTQSRQSGALKFIHKLQWQRETSLWKWTSLVLSVSHTLHNHDKRSLSSSNLHHSFDIYSVHLHSHITHFEQSILFSPTLKCSFKINASPKEI